MGGSVRTTGRRRALGALLGAVALSLAAVALVALSAGGPAEAKPKKFRTVTKTFSSNAPITIDSFGVATPYPSERNSGGFRQGKILDVNLTLKNLSHTFPDDASVLLEGPGGRDAVVMADVGGGLFGDLVNATLVLDDEASRPLPDESRITGGRFRPTRGTNDPTISGNNPRPTRYPVPAKAPPYSGALGALDGANANGAWRLFVFDDSAAESGSIAGGWSVTIKAKVRR